MERIDYVTVKGREIEKGSLRQDKHTIKFTASKKRNGKKNCSSGACAVDGQCFPLVALASR